MCIFPCERDGCVCACMHSCMCACVHAYMCICVHASAYMSSCAYMCACI